MRPQTAVCHNHHFDCYWRLLNIYCLPSCTHRVHLPLLSSSVDTTPAASASRKCTPNTSPWRSTLSRYTTPCGKARRRTSPAKRTWHWSFEALVHWWWRRCTVTFYMVGRWPPRWDHLGQTRSRDSEVTNGGSNKILSLHPIFLTLCQKN